jgi:UDP-N-acetylmuramate: L-alanyl-gamma-D-glutamyl-meso-diaminopimelate ligase
MNKKNEHIHLLGIGGTGMGSLARLFVESGYRVSGSDGRLYPPMSDQLALLKIKIYEGYSASNIDDLPDLVVIGNVITKDNPEAQEVLKRGIPYLSMPQAVTSFFIKDKTSIVVAGTHGKTTTSTLLTWLFTKAGEDPGFLVGGVGNNFGSSAHQGNGRIFVVEGDEYDTAFFDKGPKFLHYLPKVVLLTSIEFDHADIYRDLGHLKTSFEKLISIIPPDGLLIAWGEDENIRNVIGGAKARVVTYGLKEGSDYFAGNVSLSEHGTEFDLIGPKIRTRFRTPLFGEHNLLNVIGSLALLCEYGIDKDKIQEGLDTFEGVRRRQELAGEIGSVAVIDDFAHHPTAVKKTIQSVRQRYPGRRLWAVFEPRSNTSRRSVFEKEFISALSSADRVLIAQIFKPEKIPEGERLNVQFVADTLMKNGIDSHYIPDNDHLLEFLLRNVSANDVVLFMSNGEFDALPRRLVDGLKKRRIL